MSVVAFEAENGEGQRVELSAKQLSCLNAQISAYKMLARNEPVPRQLLNQATGKRSDGTLLPLVCVFAVLIIWLCIHTYAGI